jgi:predicted RNA methylase
MLYVYDIDADTIWCLFACADVAPRGREVELQRALERLPWGERRRREDIAVRPAEPEREVRRRRFDSPGTGPSHAPSAAARADFEDIRRHLETVLQEVPEGIWSRIQDEAFLE